MVRYVALGDSLTEGAGDPHPGAPNGLRGWADLVATHLATVDPATDYANLALRGRRARDVLRHQVPVTEVLRPDVVTLWSGGNDLLRPYTDVDDVARTLDETVGRLVACSGRVLVLTTFELSPSPLLRLAAGRIPALNNRIRDVARQHGAEIVEVDDFRSWSTAPVLCPDRVHPSPFGHHLLARRVMAALGADVAEAHEGMTTAHLGPRGAVSAWWEEARWWCADVVPHLARWMVDASSRDGATAKWPAPVRVTDLLVTPRDQGHPDRSGGFRQLRAL